MVGAHIRRRRERLGATASELAADAGLAPDRIESIESGNSPSTAELAAIALALETEPAVLFRGEADVAPQRSRARFLSPSGLSQIESEDMSILASAAEVGRICFQLQRLLGLPDSPVRSSRSLRGPGRGAPWKQGYELGARARLTFDGSGKPLPSVQELLEQNFVHVATVNLRTSEILAASLFEPDASPVIVLNARAWRVTQPLLRRTVLAHEFCHLLHDGGERDLTIVSRESETSDPVESRANGFAPSFLAPKEWVGEVLGEPLDRVLAIATKWGLGFQAAVWHAKNIDIITPTEADNLRGQERNVVIDSAFESARFLRRADEQGGRSEPSPLVKGLLSELVMLAHSKSLISSGRAEEIFSVR